MTDDLIRAEMVRILLDKGIVRDEDIPYAMEIAEELAPVALRLHDAAHASFRERYELLRTVERVAEVAWGVLAAAQRDGVTDLNVIAHAIARNVRQEWRP